MNGPTGPERVYVMQRGTRNILVEEGDGVEGLVLSAGGQICFEGQFRQESFELLLAGQGERHALQYPDIAPQPMNVGFLGDQRLVLSADDLSHPLNGRICMHKSLIISCLCSRLPAFQYANQPSPNQS